MSLAYNFGSGSLFAVRTDITYPTPVKFGVLQEVSLDFSFTNKELTGQYQLPVDVARGPMSIKGKAKQAQIFSAFFDLFFGQSVTPSSSQLGAINEAFTVPAPSGPYTYQTTNHTTFVQDLGVYYAATGVPLTRVAPSSEATGSYSVNVSTGTYTFAAGDASIAMLVDYEYTAASNKELVLTNQLMGSGPTFGIYLFNTYKSNIMNITLKQCTSEKLSLPLKNTDYTIMEFDFTGYCDNSLGIGAFSFSQ